MAIDANRFDALFNENTRERLKLTISICRSAHAHAHKGNSEIGLPFVGAAPARQQRIELPLITSVKGGEMKKTCGRERERLRENGRRV